MTNIWIGDKLKEEGYDNAVKFLEWLQSKGVYNVFVKEFMKDNPNKDIYSYLKEQNSSPNEYVLLAFDWGKAEYGSDFWANIDKEWLHYINNRKHLMDITKDNKKDNTNPSHYKTKQPEPIEVIEGWRLDFHLGNVIKYIARWKDKNGIEDLKKAQWYLERYINFIETKKED